MESKTRTRIFIVIVILLLLALGIYAFSSRGGNIVGAQTVAEQFGGQLQKVSLLASDASSTIAANYGPFVTPQLLQSWQKDPRTAPGKLTSSPWPDHIEISNVSQQGSGAVISGNVVYMTSTGVASREPVVIQVVSEKGQWLIAAYQEQKTANK